MDKVLEGKRIKTIGFPISSKENEKCRAIVPAHIKGILHPEMLYFERGYGEVLGIDDSEYEAFGCHIEDQNEVLTKNIICEPKIGDADYLGQLNKQTIFGWIHATQNRDITDKILNGKLTAYAWEKCIIKEDMFSGVITNWQEKQRSCMHSGVMGKCLMKQMWPSLVEETRLVAQSKY